MLLIRFFAEPDLRNGREIAPVRPVDPPRGRRRESELINRAAEFSFDRIAVENPFRVEMADPDRHSGIAAGRKFDRSVIFQREISAARQAKFAPAGLAGEVADAEHTSRFSSGGDRREPLVFDFETEIAFADRKPESLCFGRNPG